MSFSIKFTYLCLWQIYSTLSLIYSQHLTILGSCYCKKQIDVGFLCTCPLIDDNLQLLQAKQEPVQSEPTMKQEIGRDKKTKGWLS